MTVRLVHAECERLGDPVHIHDRQQLIRSAAHAVDVVADVRVNIEDLALRQVGTKLSVPDRGELERTIDRGTHDPESSGGV